MFQGATFLTHTVDTVRLFESYFYHVAASELTSPNGVDVFFFVSYCVVVVLL